MYCAALIKGRYVIQVCKDQVDGVLLLQGERLTTSAASLSLHTLCEFSKQSLGILLHRICYHKVAYSSDECRARCWS
ncbi:hypothetical protein CEX98_13920 [Pseudoalteromonas piscicida]|uniref:Uncharacterized protein n=1 Tax=Pseudoalteromonas piscicida TaxID=43662 RepID=A0A2A5JPG5_PSEO7|nr:hypothetical protein CEX98_13920 [Pseudoalteromonas piscicida]